VILVSFIVLGCVETANGFAFVLIASLFEFLFEIDDWESSLRSEIVRFHLTNILSTDEFCW
jgi:hypothetical protein